MQQRSTPFGGGVGPVAGRASDLPFPSPGSPTLPLSIMPLPSSTSSSSSSSSSSPSPSASLSLDWAFSSIPKAVTCTTISLNWTIFNSPSNLQAIYSSPSISSGIHLDITISDASSIARVQGSGSPENVLGSGGVEWLVNVPPGQYDVLGVVRSETTDTSAFGLIEPIETEFSVLEGDDESCIPKQVTGGAAAAASPTTSTSGTNKAAIAGGVVGGVLGFVVICLAAMAYLLYFKRRQRRRRGSGSIHERPSQGWNGLTSVGSVVSTSKQDMEKNYHHQHHSSFSQIVQEPGSPIGSPASVELAHFSIHPNSNPFKTPPPGTPQSRSELGHESDDINGSIVSESPSSPSSLTHASLSPPAPSLSSTLALSVQTTDINKRGSHHSRKRVPAYDELNLTLEEREALGQPQPQPQPQPHDAHARELYQNLRSKSSGHLKDETFVHYLIPDPPLEVVD